MAQSDLRHVCQTQGQPMPSMAWSSGAAWYSGHLVQVWHDAGGITVDGPAVSSELQADRKPEIS